MLGTYNIVLHFTTASTQPLPTPKQHDTSSMSNTKGQQEMHFTRNLLHWQRFKNFADGSCGPYSILQRFLVVVDGMHPCDAESIFSSKRPRSYGTWSDFVAK